jgi:integral membrane protein (TIGR01906 family)
MLDTRHMRLPIYLAIGLFVLCIPLFLLSTHISWATNDINLYKYGFNKYNVSQETGISDGQLDEITKAVVQYINSGERAEALDIFDENEMAHLQDVRQLILIDYIVAGCALGYMVVFVAGGFVWLRKRFVQILTKLALAGSILTLALLIILGISAIVDFYGLFSAFHRLFFSGDSGVLSGYMPCIFTEGFFGDTTLFITAAILVESLILGGISGFFVLRTRRNCRLTAAGGTSPS